jgi:peptidoglycan/xylan/chitin deacetylase (PgdA/CDA1 family)
MKIAARIAAAALLLGSLVAPLTHVEATTANLISNPSAETSVNGAPTGWLQGGWGTNTTSFAYTSAGAEDGSHALQVSVSGYSSGDAKWYFAPVAVSGSTSYAFSDYYESTVATELVADYTDASGNATYVDLESVPASATWTQTNVTLTAPASATSVTIFHLIAANGTLTTDNFSLTTAPVVSPTSNIVPNSSLETTNGSLPASWQSGSWGTNTPAFSYLTTGYNGNRSVKVQMTKYSSGDAKWYFTEQAVTPGVLYDVSDYYQSTVATDVVAGVTLADGSAQYFDLGAAPASAGWTQYKGQFTTPANAKSATIYHLIAAVGTLTTSDYDLQQDAVAVTGILPNAQVNQPSFSNPSVPADWQHSTWGTNNAAFSYLTTGVNGSRALQVKMTTYTSGDGKWFFNPLPVTQDTQYKFSDYYESTTPTQVEAAFVMPDGSTLYQIVGMADPASTWTQFNTTFSVPLGAVNVTIYHLLMSVGTLTTSDFALQPYTPVGFSSPLVTLTFDDGYNNDYTQGLPLLQKYGLTSTQFIITDDIGQSGYMTAAQVKAFAAAGDEMGSHTVTHDDMQTETAAQVTAELANSKTQLAAWTGKPVTDMAFPNGLYSNSIIAATKNYYSAARGVEDGLNSKDNFNAYDLKVQNVFDTTTTAQITDWIHQAQMTNTWLVIVYHSVDPNVNNALDGGLYNVTPTQLDTQLAAIKATGVPVKTMSQALAQVEPQL